MVNYSDVEQFRGEHEFLSNFYPHEFEWSGDTWKTAEHAFQAAKVDQPLDYFRCRDAATPAAAKRIGRHVAMREGWDRIKDDVMSTILRAKFRSTSPLYGKLLGTEGRRLIEGNAWGDKYWGVDLKTGEGENRLGRILTGLRDEFLAKEYERGGYDEV